MLLELTRYHRLLRRLGQHIKENLQTDLLQQVETAGADIETLLIYEPPLVQEDWSRMKGWCKDSNGYAPLPAWITIKRIMVERVALYQMVPPSVEINPVSVETFAVDD